MPKISVIFDVKKYCSIEGDWYSNCRYMIGGYGKSGLWEWKCVFFGKVSGEKDVFPVYRHPKCIDFQIEEDKNVMET